MPSRLDVLAEMAEIYPGLARRPAVVLWYLSQAKSEYGGFRVLHWDYLHDVCTDHILQEIELNSTLRHLRKYLREHPKSRGFRDHIQTVYGVGARLIWAPHLGGRPPKGGKGVR